MYLWSICIAFLSSIRHSQRSSCSDLWIASTWKTVQISINFYITLWSKPTEMRYGSTPSRQHFGCNLPDPQQSSENISIYRKWKFYENCEIWGKETVNATMQAFVVYKIHTCLKFKHKIKQGPLNFYVASSDIVAVDFENLFFYGNHVVSVFSQNS